MPTIFRIGAVRVVIYPNDHRPAHVHVVGLAIAPFSTCNVRADRRR